MRLLPGFLLFFMFAAVSAHASTDTRGLTVVAKDPATPPQEGNLTAA